MLRIFLLGLAMIGLAMGWRNQWFEDVDLPGLNQSQPVDFNRWLMGEPDRSAPSS